MPNGFDVIPMSEILSGFVQGGILPADVGEGGSDVLILSPGAKAKLRALAVATKEGRQPPGLVRQTAQDILDSLDNPTAAAWRGSLTGDTDAEANP